MTNKRDYKAEYRRRIERGLAKGLSRSQARGHTRVADKPTGKARRQTGADLKLEEAYKELRRGASLQKAAKRAHVSRERLRRYIGEEKLAKWNKRKWIVTDKRSRKVATISKGRIIDVVVPNLKEAMRAGKFWDAQGRFIRTNNISLLKPFKDKGVKDIKDKFHPFETDPNELHRIASMDGPVFHEIYQITVN